MMDKNKQPEPVIGITPLSRGSVVVDFEMKDEISGKTLPIKVEFNDMGQIYMMPQGYSEACSEDGDGIPVMIEFYEKELRFILHTDINEEDPKIINMEKARETNRRTIPINSRCTFRKEGRI